MARPATPRATSSSANVEPPPVSAIRASRPRSAGSPTLSSWPVSRTETERTSRPISSPRSSRAIARTRARPRPRSSGTRSSSVSLAVFPGGEDLGRAQGTWALATVLPCLGSSIRTSILEQRDLDGDAQGLSGSGVLALEREEHRRAQAGLARGERRDEAQEQTPVELA